MFHAEVELTNHCNTRCLHCPHETISRPRGKMDWQTFETIVEKIRGHVNGEKSSLSFSGMGEPMLNASIYRFIKHVSADAFTSFATNGDILTADNVRKLIAAGLDQLYVSFNGDEPALYAQMMGGLSFDRVQRHLRHALELARGTRLQIRANVSLTKANRDRITPLRDMLVAEGIETVTLSLCHSRGGNLRDPAVYDTPAPPHDPGHCEVLKNTLFVDWRGTVFICDHDLHGEHSLGDLMTEPLEIILQRRQQLVANGMPFKICRECNDLLKLGFHPLESRAGGILSDWLYELYKQTDDPLPEATPSLRWLVAIARQENRLERIVNHLLVVEKSLQREITAQKQSRAGEAAHYERRLRELEGELDSIRNTGTWRLRTWLHNTTQRVVRFAHPPPTDGPRPEI